MKTHPGRWYGTSDTPGKSARSGSAGGVEVLEEGPRESSQRPVEGVAAREGVVGLVGAPVHEGPNALEGGWALVARPQPFPFKLEDANMRASDLERGKHDSQLQCLSLRCFSLIRGHFDPDGFNSKAYCRSCPMNMSRRAGERLGNGS